MSTSPYIALLRGINVGGRNKIPMAELRALCADLGWAEVQSYIQSGNLIFNADTTPEQLEPQLEQAIEQQFGFSISVIVRPATDWHRYIESNPFPEASESEPNRVMLALSKSSPRPDAAATLQERATNNERVTQLDDALWIHYADGSARSKLSPALLDRLVGSPVTTRNWRTVLKLAALLKPS